MKLVAAEMQDLLLVCHLGLCHHSTLGNFRPNTEGPEAETVLSNCVNDRWTLSESMMEDFGGFDPKRRLSKLLLHIQVEGAPGE